MPTPFRWNIAKREQLGQLISDNHEQEENIDWLVRKRGGRKPALGTRSPMAIPQGANQRWSLDFVSDTLLDGRRFRILCVIDDFTRECLTTVVDNSLSGIRVARELDRLAEFRERPCTIISDNGTELTSNAILKWQEEAQVDWHYIAPGKPMQNGQGLKNCRIERILSLVDQCLQPELASVARLSGRLNQRRTALPPPLQIGEDYRCKTEKFP